MEGQPGESRASGQFVRTLPPRWDGAVPAVRLAGKFPEWWPEGLPPRARGLLCMVSLESADVRFVTG